MNRKKILTALTVFGMFLAQCRGGQSAIEGDTSSKLSSVSIGEFTPTPGSNQPTWSKMNLSLERLAPNPTSIARSYNKGNGSEISDASLEVAYGTYKILLNYLDDKGTKIYESCEQERSKEHKIDVPKYSVEIKICLIGGKEPIGSAPPKNAEVVIKPVIVTDKTPSANFVDQHGALKVQAGKIVDKNGQPVQLRGMSLFWSHWSPQFWNKGVVSTLANDWKSTVIRAAMGVEVGGYLTNPQAEKDRVKLIVAEAVAQGIYVIIDWHDHNAEAHPDKALEFFTEMAGLYANTPNVIFEVFNEPVNQSWAQVKTYAESMISAIRAKGAKNLVIVGSPTWSQRVDQAADNPINDSNVAYTLHFYAATHKQDLRDKAIYAINKGLALFVTEFGVCDASGNGAIDLAETDIWMAFLDTHKISWANWSLNDKAESASALKPGASTTGQWTANDLTPSGDYVRKKIMAGQR